MTQPTREELINFMKKHGAENVDSITDEQSAIRHFRAQSKVFKDERDEYKKQLYIIWINPKSHKTPRYYFANEHEIERYFEFLEDE